VHLFLDLRLLFALVVGTRNGTTVVFRFRVRTKDVILRNITPIPFPKNTTSNIRGGRVRDASSPRRSRGGRVV
jgi:hypothetical protein